MLDAHPLVDRGVVGQAAVERRIGRGAMGAVYLGKDPRINRPVALKAIPIENGPMSIDIRAIPVDIDPIPIGIKAKSI